jgi:hypothetical protein
MSDITERPSNNFFIIFIHGHLSNRPKEKAKRSLENAKKDGHICFKSKNTRRDMTVLAETCQKLAKFPSTRDYGPKFVKSEAMFFFATQSLFHIHQDQTDRKRFYWSNDNRWDPITVREDEKNILQHCLNILIQITSRNKRRNVQTFNREFRGLKATLYHIVPSEENNFIRPLFVYAFDVPSDVFIFVFTVCQNIQEFSQKRLHSRFQAIVLNEYVLSDIFENSSIFPFPKSLRCLSKDFKFDFFVCHSPKDSDWVHNMLLRHLESTFDEQDISCGLLCV